VSNERQHSAVKQRTTYVPLDENFLSNLPNTAECKIKQILLSSSKNLMSNSKFSTAAPQLGSGAWTNAPEYEEGGEHHLRATEFLAAINWEGLCKLASTHRGGIHCHISENYSLGNFNMVRALEFSDGTTWVARPRLPDLGVVSESRGTLGFARVMESEVAIMKFLRSAGKEFNLTEEFPTKSSLQSSIPVPKVLHYDPIPHNDIGAPYLLMSYINGPCASEQCLKMASPVGQFGNFIQDSNFRRQMAEIQVKL